MREDFAALNEITITGYGTPQKRDVSSAIQGRVAGVNVSGNTGIIESSINETVVIENQTTVEIEVEQPYSIKSDGEKLLVDLKKYQIDALYEYYAVPKLDKDAFLVARIINWGQYNLLEGEANLYF